MDPMFLHNLLCPLVAASNYIFALFFRNVFFGLVVFLCFVCVLLFFGGGGVGLFGMFCCGLAVKLVAFGFRGKPTPS